MVSVDTLAKGAVGAASSPHLVQVARLLIVSQGYAAAGSWDALLIRPLVHDTQGSPEATISASPESRRLHNMSAHGN